MKSISIRDGLLCIFVISFIVFSYLKKDIGTYEYMYTESFGEHNSDDMNTEKIHFLNTKDGSMFTYLSSSFVNETSDSLSFINVYRAYKTTPKSWEDRSRTETYPKQK